MKYETFKDFYPFYLSEHSNLICRRLHFIGTTGSIFFFIRFLVTMDPINILFGLLAGYSMAWIGHFVFEKNRPASFKQPIYSFIGDFRMYFDVLRGRVKIF
jgi:hypothetical protein